MCVCVCTRARPRTVARLVVDVELVAVVALTAVLARRVDALLLAAAVLLQALVHVCSEA